MKGGNQVARESSPNRPTTGRETPRGIAVTNPRDPRSAEGRGNVEGRHQSSMRVVKRAPARGIIDGLRSAGGPRQIGWLCGAEKHVMSAAYR